MTAVFIALGANLPSPRYGAPRETLDAAVADLARRGLTVVARSRWYESAPVPPSDQPWFVNGVIEGRTDMTADTLLGLLHKVEASFGRVRREKWEARVLDIDLLAYGETVRNTGEGPILPHPRMHERRFVLEPMADIAPDWRHPVLGKTTSELLDALDSDEIIRPL